jgi:microcystin-dependent protein
MTTTVPVGCLVMFGGSVEGVKLNELRAQGWLLCDGLAYPVQTFGELYDRIGSGYGGGTDMFNVPDFRGRFARGTDRGRGKDPDAGARTALKPGGSAGDQVGSAQAYATSLPSAPFTTAEDGKHQHVAPHLTSKPDDTPLSVGGSNVMLWPGDDSTTSQDQGHSHAVTGGDAESRPANLYCHYLIKFANVEGTATAGVAAAGPAAVPIGTVLPFAGDADDHETARRLRSEGWLPCYGQPLDALEYGGLFEVVRHFFGGSAGTFSLPDLRGMFVRGARTDDRPGPGGTLGTSQDDRTARPSGERPFEAALTGGHGHSLNFLPTEAQRSYHSAGRTTAAFGAADTKVDAAGEHWHTITGGGDAETRPVNLYVDFIIKFAEPAAR